ncbi:hypothetical protein PCANC_11232 [Puccinia coronata f. sp. avenae]|uniref:Uncharacterized protein n=1 Tax=Puccinia coronata f. sp. avenae TaxID=200324 RepID=A0A2N5V8J7_9BASI|nr:hypothetical protein PCANC_11232 [Puccinia coronata f. sp. avenae]
MVREGIRVSTYTAGRIPSSGAAPVTVQSPRPRGASCDRLATCHPERAGASVRLTVGHTLRGRCGRLAGARRPPSSLRLGSTGFCATPAGARVTAIRPYGRMTIVGRALAQGLDRT